MKPLVTIRCPWGCAIGYVETDPQGKPTWRHHQPDRVIKRDIIGDGRTTSFRPWYGGDCRHKPYMFQVPREEIEEVWKLATRTEPLTRFARPLKFGEDVVRDAQGPVLFTSDQLTDVLKRLGQQKRSASDSARGREGSD